MADPLGIADSISIRGAIFSLFQQYCRDLLLPCPVFSTGEFLALHTTGSPYIYTDTSDVLIFNPSAHLFFLGDVLSSSLPIGKAYALNATASYIASFRNSSGAYLEIQPFLVEEYFHLMGKVQEIGWSTWLRAYQIKRTLYTQTIMESSFNHSICYLFCLGTRWERGLRVILSCSCLRIHFAFWCFRLCCIRVLNHKQMVLGELVSCH